MENTAKFSCDSLPLVGVHPEIRDSMMERSAISDQKSANALFCLSLMALGLEGAQRVGGEKRKGKIYRPLRSSHGVRRDDRWFSPAGEGPAGEKTYSICAGNEPCIAG